MVDPGWRSRGYIPHCDQQGLIQHIVFSTIGEGEGASGDLGIKLLASPAAAGIVERALLHFDKQRYSLLAWCVMPNHVHVVLEQAEGWPLASVVHSWKSYTANAVNRALGRTGPLWLREYFDRYMRDDADLAAAITYVEANPVAAGLAARPEEWQWSSTRARKR